MPSTRVHYSRRPAEVISPPSPGMLQSASRRSTSSRMPPSPIRPPSLRIPPADATYMPSFPESHYQPVIYQASPAFSEPQLSSEATWDQPSPGGLPGRHYYEESPTYLVSQPPSQAIWYETPEWSPTFSDDLPIEINYYPPSPKEPSMSKRDPPRRPPQAEATMIKGTNVNIGHANMNMTTTQINKPPEKVDALGLLRSHSSPAALLDANERFEPPRCIKGTRLNIIRKLGDWIRHDSRHNPRSSVFWLYGGVGAGKSALSQTVAEEFKQSGNLAATFFFGADANRNDGNRLIPTLALQLVLESFQGVTPFVEEKIVQNPDVFKKSRRTQMSDLLVDPLRRLKSDGEQAHSPLPPHPRLIVIDGLDECSDRDIQCDLLRIIASAIPHFPYPLRFLITSRSESHITRVFKHDLKKVDRYNLSDDSDSDDDIRIFLKGEFANIRRTREHLPSKWPHRGAITSIVERASGHFIYASTVMRFIQAPEHRPDDRLQIILGLKQARGSDRPYARLDSLYELIFLQIKDREQLENIHRTFGIMHLRSLKSGLFAWPQWTSDRHTIETLLELRPGDLVLLFDPLLSLVTFEKGNIRILHKSLFDYLLDSRRSGDFELDLSLAHGTAADYILKYGSLQDNWYSEQFQDFTYHCQFTHLDDTLKDFLRSVASTKPVLSPHVPFEQSRLLRSMVYFLQVITRQDFDPSYYRNYVKEKTRCLKSVVPWSQRLKRMIPMFTNLEVIRKSGYYKRCLRSSFGFKLVDLKRIQPRDTNKFGRIPIPVVNTTIIKAIEQEHKMISSYVKARHRYPDIVVSFLEPSAGLIHSSHFAFRGGPTVGMTFVMLVTYTNDGLRLSCSEFVDLVWPGDSFQENIRNLVIVHLRRTEQELNNGYTGIKSYI